jgi:hypothetical protein
VNSKFEELKTWYSSGKEGVNSIWVGGRVYDEC